MKGRNTRRNVVLSAAIATAAYFTACPPYAVTTLAPGRPDIPRRTAGAQIPRADAVMDWRDALNAGGSPPPARGPAARTSSDFARGLTASALGMTSERIPATTEAAERTLPPVPASAAAGDPSEAADAVREVRSRARAASRTQIHAAVAKAAPREEDAEDEGTLGAGRDAASALPAHDAARRARLTEEESAGGAVDLRRGRPRASSLFAPTRRTTHAARRAAHRTPRFRPLRLSQLLGGKALRPPPAALRPPVGLAGLALKRPHLDSSGRVVPPPCRELGAIEGVSPDDIGSDRRQDAHWDGATWHERRAHGLARDGGWLWLVKDGQRWWGLVDSTPLVRYQSLWWMRENDLWFLVHEGEPWVWRHFQDWDEQGLFHPATGTEIVYSTDLARAAVITPGEGAVVYDARSGVEIGRIPEDAMPARRRPKAPKSLSLP